ncbi:hypothetical protein ACEWY4_021631 [Coilia grayii]|uniref:Adhesion G-protein coupled receptor G2-like n=1 Tax=Coilia grayii TaxID=363190 RepID=A0ABD1J795_9TELE
MERNNWIIVAISATLMFFGTGYCIVREVRENCANITISDEGFGGIITYNSSCPNITSKHPAIEDSCIFVFDTGSDTMQHGERNYSLQSLGFWLENNTSSYFVRVTSEGKQFSFNINTTGNCSFLNTKALCSNAKKGPCKGVDDSFEYQIHLDDNEPTCVKCGSSSTEPPQLDLSKTNITTVDTQGGLKAAEAVKIVEQLSSLVELMGDKPTASVSIGEIKGVMVKPKSEDDLRKLSFGSIDSGLNIIQDHSIIDTMPMSVTVSEEAYKMSYQKQRNETIVGVFRFPNMAVGENLTALTDKVYAIEMGTHISNLSEPIQLKFNAEIPKGRNLSCQSWDGKGSEPNWTDAGCNTKLKERQVICECNHLTFFAVLMTAPDFTKDPIPSSDLSSLTYISYIGCGVSVFFLGIALFMFFCIRKAKASNGTHILLHLLMALFMLNVTFLTNEWIANLKSDIGCKIMAAIMHYAMLSSFSWFAVEAFHLCLQMTKYAAMSVPHYKLKLCIAGWVPPAIVVLAIFILGRYGELVISADDGAKSRMCWIVDSATHYVVNIGYYALVFLFTFTVFVVMLRWLCYFRSSKVTGSGAKQSGTRSGDVITIMGLCCTLGIAWSFAFFSHGPLRTPSFYIFSILNSLQGLFLFIYYYNTSKLIGDADTSSPSTSTTTTTTSKLGFHSPYENYGN